MIFINLIFLYHLLWQLLWRSDGVWWPSRCEEMSPFVEQASVLQCYLQKELLKFASSYTVFERARIWICDISGSYTDFATIYSSSVPTISSCKCKLGTWRTRLLSTRGKTKSQSSYQNSRQILFQIEF